MSYKVSVIAWKDDWHRATYLRTQKCNIVIKIVGFFTHMADRKESGVGEPAPKVTKASHSTGYHWSVNGRDL